MKNILILDTGKEWGGGTNSLLELLKRIDKNKYHFTALFYNNYKKGNDSEIKSEIEKLGIDFQLIKRKKQPLAVKALKELGRLLLFFSKKAIRHYIFFIDYHFRIKPDSIEIMSILKKQDIDLLYMNNQPSSNLAGMLAAKDFEMPVIQHARSNAQLLPKEVKIANQRLARMICVSNGLKFNYLRQGIKKDIVYVVYNGIDTTITPAVSPDIIRKELRINDNEMIIGMVGSLMKRKGFDIFIKALSHLKNTAKNFKGLVIGSGPIIKDLMRLTDTLGLRGYLIFAGFKDDVFSYINAVDILVLSSFGEGLPRVILEAMLAGKPVVASNVTGSSELVIDGETGFLVPAGHPALFADAILKLLENPDLRKQMGEKARKRVIENFSIEGYVNGVEHVFAEVLEQ